jgi:hypothetical protein
MKMSINPNLVYQYKEAFSKAYPQKRVEVRYVGKYDRYKIGIDGEFGDLLIDEVQMKQSISGFLA